MKAHICADADSGLVHTVIGTPANTYDAIVNEIERLKASVRAKVEHPFRVIKRQFGFVTMRYRGLAKNTAQLTTLFALSNLWTARRELMVMMACIC